MIKQKYLRIVEIIIAIVLFACVWLNIIHHPLAKPVLVISTSLICFLYLLYNHVFFLDEESKIIPGKRAIRKKYGFKTSIYSWVAGFICGLIAVFGMRMILTPAFHLMETVYILSMVIGGFFIFGILQRKDKMILNVLLDGIRSMIIIITPFIFYSMMMGSTLAAPR
jgi:hypothetical protein